MWIFGGVGESAAVFLDLYYSGAIQREAGVIIMADGASSLYINPAALLSSNGLEVYVGGTYQELCYTSALACGSSFSNLAKLSGVDFFEKIPGALGFSVRFLSCGPVEEVDSSGFETGNTFLPFSVAAGLSYAVSLGTVYGEFKSGILANFVMESFLENYVGGAVDAGVLYKPPAPGLIKWLPVSIETGFLVHNLGYITTGFPPTRIDFSFVIKARPVTGLTAGIGVETGYGIIDSMLNFKASADVRYYVKHIDTALAISGGYDVGKQMLSGGLGTVMNFLKEQVGFVPKLDIGVSYHRFLGLTFTVSFGAII